VIEYIAVPRELLYSQLKEGKHNQGRPRLRFKDTVRGNMKKMEMAGKRRLNIETDGDV